MKNLMDIDINTACNEIMRNGKILVSNRTETERYCIVLYNKKWYEIETELGNFIDLRVNHVAPIYLQVLVDSKHNEIKKKENANV